MLPFGNSVMETTERLFSFFFFKVVIFLSLKCNNFLHLLNDFLKGGMTEKESYFHP